MSNNFEKPGTPEASLHEQLTALDSEYTTRRAALLAAMERERQEALKLAKDDIYLEHDTIAQEAVRTGKTAAGEAIPDIKAFLLARRAWLASNPGLSGDPRRAEELPRDVRADDPKIWQHE